MHSRCPPPLPVRVAGTEEIRHGRVHRRPVMHHRGPAVLHQSTARCASGMSKMTSPAARTTGRRRGAVAGNAVNRRRRRETTMAPGLGLIDSQSKGPRVRSPQHRDLHRRAGVAHAIRRRSPETSQRLDKGPHVIGPQLRATTTTVDRIGDRKLVNNRGNNNRLRVNAGGIRERHRSSQRVNVGGHQGHRVSNDRVPPVRRNHVTAVATSVGAWTAARRIIGVKLVRRRRSRRQLPGATCVGAAAATRRSTRESKSRRHPGRLVSPRRRRLDQPWALLGHRQTGSGVRVATGLRKLPRPPALRAIRGVCCLR